MLSALAPAVEQPDDQQQAEPEAEPAQEADARFVRPGADDHAADQREREQAAAGAGVSDAGFHDRSHASPGGPAPAGTEWEDDRAPAKAEAQWHGGVAGFLLSQEHGDLVYGALIIAVGSFESIRC